MVVLGYLRVSKGVQDVDSQKLSVLEYARTHKLIVNRWREITISSQKSLEERQITDTVLELEKGDLLIVAELSRLGRSLAQVIQIIQSLADRKIDFVSVKEQLEIWGGKQTSNVKVMIAVFGILAELERDLISLRTKEGLRRIQETGRHIGRKKGVPNKHSKCDDRLDEIKYLLGSKVPVAAIARVIKVSATNLRHYLRTRAIGTRAGGEIL